MSRPRISACKGRSSDPSVIDGSGCAAERDIDAGCIDGTEDAVPDAAVRHGVDRATAVLAGGAVKDGPDATVGASGPQRAATGSGPGLRARAIALLAGRDHSRAEMRRKLARHADSGESLEAVLDDLQQRGYLSEQRFAQSLVDRRVRRYGLRRIASELEQHDVPESVSAPMIAALADGERERALEAWRRRFGRPPADISEKGRQYRFLAQRGFGGEVIHWVFRMAGATPDDDI